MKRKQALWLLSFVIAGCGGGTQPTAGGGSLQVGSAGNAKFTYSGSAKPQIQTAENGLSVTSLAGVSISSFIVDPAQTNTNSALSYGSPNYTLATYQNGVVQPITGGLVSDAYCSQFGHDGHVYMGTRHSDESRCIDRAYYDGSGQTTIYTTTGHAVWNISVSPDDSKIAFEELDNGVYTVTSSGTNLTTIDAAGSEPAISPDGTKVAYVKTIGDYTQIVIQPIGGGTIAQLTTDSDNHGYPTWSADGNLILCDVDDGSSVDIASFVSEPGSNFGTFYAEYLIPAYEWVSHAALSPDGKYLACLVSPSYTPTSLNLDIIGLATNSDQEIASNASDPAWSPYFANRTFLGTSAYLYSSAAGFLYTQLQTGFDSLLAFTATTPSDAKCTLVSQPGASGPFLYDLHADTITGIKYVNLYYSNPITLTPNTSDALVSIDSTTGQIATIAPYVATRGGALQAKSGALTFTAHFTGVFDAHGKNLAPSGASQLVLDPKHGTMVSVTPATP